MAYRNGNYAAFYVKEPFNAGNLGAHATKDFVSYNLLKLWKANDSLFPFIDSHEKNYNVRDGSDWEGTLRPRIRERLRNSKNIILFMSSITKNSRALREEIDYGINTLGLPVIVIYPDFDKKTDIINCKSRNLKKQIIDLWCALPKFRDLKKNVPVLHIPIKKAVIKLALQDNDFKIQSKRAAGDFFYLCEG